MNKDIGDIIDVAEDAGWSAEMDGAGHWRLTRPDGAAISIPVTPGDYRTIRNVTADLRRMGLNLNGNGNPFKCEHSWHRDQVGGRYCPLCRSDWVYPDASTYDNPEFLKEMLELGHDPDEIVSAVTEVQAQRARSEQRELLTRPLNERLEEYLAELSPGTYVSIADMHAAHPDVERTQISATLRAMNGRLERTKKGRYRLRYDSEMPDPQPEPAQEEAVVTTEDRTNTEVDLSTVDLSASEPPDPTKEWRWKPGIGWVEAPAADDQLIFELVTTDAKGRFILKDEQGDLYCAVPMAPQF